MRYQAAPHSSLGLDLIPCGLYHFMSLIEGTALLFDSLPTSVVLVLWY